jgi:hypothetical protein
MFLRENYIPFNNLRRKIFRSFFPYRKKNIFSKIFFFKSTIYFYILLKKLKSLWYKLFYMINKYKTKKKNISI